MEEGVATLLCATWHALEGPRGAGAGVGVPLHRKRLRNPSLPAEPPAAAVAAEGLQGVEGGAGGMLTILILIRLHRTWRGPSRGLVVPPIVMYACMI